MNSKITVYIHENITADGLIPLIFRLCPIDNLEIDVYISQKVNREDNRILKMSEAENLNFSQIEARSGANLSSLLFGRLPHLARRCGLDPAKYYKKNKALQNIDPINKMIIDSDLLIVDSISYWKNPRITQLVERCKAPVWVCAATPYRHVNNKKNRHNAFKGDLELCHQNHKFIAFSKYDTNLDELAVSVSNSVIYLGDIMISDEYLKLCAKSISRDHVRSDILFILGPHMYADKLKKFIELLAEDGNKVLIRQHPRKFKKTFSSEEFGEEKNVKFVTQESNIVPFILNTKFVVCSYSSLLLQVIHNQIPLLVPENLIKMQKIENMSKFAPDNVIATDRDEMLAKYEIFRRDRSAKQLLPSVEFINSNYYSVLNQSDLEHRLFKSIEHNRE